MERQRGKRSHWLPCLRAKIGAGVDGGAFVHQEIAQPP